MNNNNEKPSKFNIKEITKKLNEEFTEEVKLDEAKETDDFKEKLYQHYDFNFDKIEFTDSELNNENIEEVSNVFKETAPIEIPNYLFEVYNWAYLNPKNAKRLDKSLIVNFILFGNSNKLIKSYLSEIPAGSKMLQVANSYGNLLPKLAKKIGATGSLDLIDIIPLQLALAYHKLQDFNNIDIWQQDASVAHYRDYSVIGSYFLLHEVPTKVKVEIIDNILDQVDRNNAKAIFIDYHPPVNYHPLKPIINLINTIFQPFARDLWEYNIEDFAKESEKFNWEKITYFGKLYQKVVVTKKV